MQSNQPIVLFDPDTVSGEQDFDRNHHTALPLDVDFRLRLSSSSTTEPQLRRRRRLPEISVNGPKSSTMRILLGSLAGLILGLCLAVIYEFCHQPEWLRHASRWIQLPGRLFIRALNCIIMPMVLANTAASVTDSVLSGRVRQLLGWRTVGLFFLSSLCSAIAGAILVGSFVTIFPTETEVITDSIVKFRAELAFACGNKTAYVGPNVFCSRNGTGITVESKEYLPWKLRNESIRPRTLTDHIMIVIEQLVTDNLFKSMADGNLLSVIMVAVPIGVAAASASIQLEHSKMGHCLDALLRSVRDLFVIILGWVVDLTPWAMVSVIAGAILDSTIASVGQYALFFYDAGKLIIPLLIGALTHIFIVLPLVFYLLLRSNPYDFMKLMSPAYVFAMGASSSLATMPIAISTMIDTKQVPKIVPQFIFPIATVVNMNASGIYMAMHVAFMAYKEGYSLSFEEIAILMLVSILASIGTPPIPNGGLIMLLTIWNTVLLRPHTGIPASFSIVFACDFLTDRIATVLNVTGNIMVTRIIAEEVDATVVEAIETRHSSGNEGY